MAEKEYIERDAAIKAAVNGLRGVPSVAALEMVEALEDVPAADVVEVVRCKDCKHRNTPDCKMWYQCVICGDYHHWERDDYYCSYGVRKEQT